MIDYLRLLLTIFSYGILAREKGEHTQKTCNDGVRLLPTIATDSFLKAQRETWVYAELTALAKTPSISIQETFRARHVHQLCTEVARTDQGSSD